MSLSENKGRDWANLPNDLLHTISTNLQLPVDYLAFGKVCSTWRAARAPTSPSQKPFLLSVVLKSSVPERSYMFSDISNIDNVSYKNYSNFNLRGTMFVGSQDGWLITVNTSIALYNPFTNQQVKLPSLSTVPNLEGGLTAQTMSSMIHRTVIFEPSQISEERIVVATINQRPYLIFARPSDKAWSYKSKTGYGMYKYLCNVDNKVFASQNGVDIYRVQLNRTSFSTTRIEVLSSCILVEESIETHIVKLGKDIVHVRACLDDSGETSSRVVVERLDLEKNFWVHLEDLGDYSLFLGRWCSTAQQSTTGLRKTLIYFNLSSYRWVAEKCQIGVFDMEDGSYKTYKIPNRRCFGALSVWFFAPYLTMLKGISELK